MSSTYYENMCKSCWHSWKSNKKPEQCPECKGKDIHTEKEIRLSE